MELLDSLMKSGDLVFSTHLDGVYNESRAMFFFLIMIK